MSLDDKILEIIKKNPLKGTRDIHDLLQKQYGYDKSYRTTQRHVWDKLYENKKIIIAGYIRGKGPLFKIWEEGAKYESIFDCPEINEVDWSKVPSKIVPSLIHFWNRGETIPWFRDLVRLTLKSYSMYGSTKEVRSWGSSIIEKLKNTLK